MPTFEITAPDGKRYRVSGESAEGALAALQKMTGGGEDKPPAFERAGAFLTSAVEGVPIVGPYALEGLQRAGAYGRSLRSGNPFEDELEHVQGMTEGAQEAHPYISTAGNVAGAVAGLAPLGATALGARALGLTGRSMLGKAAAGAASGAAIGAGDAAVRSDGDPTEIAKGAGFGAAGGMAAPYVGQAVGAGVRRVTDAFTRPGGALSHVPRRAAVFASETIPASRAPAVRSDLARLGPDATLADVSPEWMGVARGAAARPGSRDEIVNHFLDRGAGANARLGSDLDAGMGQAVVPSQVERQIADARKALGPEYEAVLNGASRVNTEPLALDLDAMIVDLRGDARTAVQRVREMLNLHGTNELDPSPRALLNTRQAIDGLMGSTQDRNVQRVLGLARESVDGMLGAAAPGVKNVDAKFAALMRESDALERGGQILDIGKTAVRPSELQSEMSAMTPQARGRLAQGTRAEIDRIAGTNANDPAALQKTVRGEGDWNRDKLRAIYGAGADKALDAIDRETTFYRTGNRVTSGSDTAMGEGFRNFIDDAAKTKDIPISTSAVGAVLRGGQEAWRAFAGDMAARKAEKFAKDLGRLSIATGQGRDQLIDAMLDYAMRRSGGGRISEAARKATQLGVMGMGATQAPLRVYLNAGERDRQTRQ